MKSDYFTEIIKSVSSLEGLVPCKKLNLEQAIAIYSTGYRVRMTEALGETFEVVWWCLGDELFFNVCREFIKENPSSFYNLSDYGAKFPEFLKTISASLEMPFLKCLAQFEWAFKEIFHAPEQKSLESSTIPIATSLVNPKVKFTSQMRLLSYPYGIRNVWRCFKNAQDNDHFEKPDWKTPQSFLIYKKDHGVFLKDLSVSEFSFLTRLTQGIGIEEAALGLDIAETSVTELFEFLFTHNLIADIHP